MSPNEAFEEAIRLAGGQGEFATIVGATQQKVSYALRKQQRMPAEWVLAAERQTSVSRHCLRPDIYPLEDQESSLSAVGL